MNNYSSYKELFVNQKVLSSLEKLWAASSENSKLSREQINQDILDFIDAITIENSMQRLESFSLTYFNNSSLKSSGSFSPRTNIYLPELFYSAILTIGAIYTLKPEEKNNTDVLRFNEIMQGLKVVETQEIENNTESILKLPGETEARNEPNIEEILEKSLSQLNELIGLEVVKSEINSLINLIRVNQIRKKRGLKVPNISNHLVFEGNPGTGKTTVARLLSNIYKGLGILKKGQLIEVDRSGLVASHVGETALKTQAKIDEAIGGILFIDEAYTLAKGDKDFGQEAIDTLLKAMEDKRDEFIVIVAGYSQPMQKFLYSNPGLESRFNKFLHFEDYNGEQLLEIFNIFCRNNDVVLTLEAEEILKNRFKLIVENKNENFANGRLVRNLFEETYSNQANRLATMPNITNDDLKFLQEQDLPC